MVQEITSAELTKELISLDARSNAQVIERVQQLLERYPHRQVAEALLALPRQSLANLLVRLDNRTVADLLSELEPAEGASLLLRLTQARAADVLEEMDPDDATDLVQSVEVIDKRLAADLLLEVQPVEADEIRGLLAYPEHSAGGIMTTRVATVSPEQTIDQALIAIRSLAAERRTELVYYLYVVDADRRLVGVVALRDLVLAPPGTKIGEIMQRSFISVDPSTDQEEVARMLTQRRLLAIPVVSPDRRLLGIVTTDDIADVLSDEVTEDFQHVGGSQPLAVRYTRASPWLLFRKRIGWLVLLFVAGTYTSTILQAFEDELARAVVLTYFIPLLIGTGGNVGSQVVTTVVRAQAIGQVRFPDLLRVLWKEWRTSILLGAVLFSAAFGLAWTMGLGLNVQLTVGIAVALIVFWASTVGAVLPLILPKLGIDPAVASAPMITTVVDGTGLIIYLTIARLLLNL